MNTDKTPKPHSPAATDTADSFSTSGANKLAPRRQIVAWAMFDFANSGFTTVVLTAIFSAYFVKVISGTANGSGESTFYWTLAMAIANLLVLTSAPILGAIADHSGYKKRFLAFSTVICVVFTLLLATVERGEVMYGMFIVVIATIMFSSGENFIAAFLPEISPPEHMGRISGYGWALGYLGGLLVLGICLAYVTWAEGHGLGAEHYVPVTMIITAFSFALAALPTFLWLPERAVHKKLPSAGELFSVGFKRVAHTVRASRQFTDLGRALLAMAIYHSGIYTVIVLASIYASEVMGFSTRDTITLILIVNLTAAIGAFFFGHIQDRIGSIKSIQGILLVWIAALVIVISSSDRAGFWIAANLIGLALGASQSGGRALIGQFSPPNHSAEFFGLWGLAVKTSAIIGPMAYGTIALMTKGDHKIALAATIIFFVVGFVVISTVNETRGRQSAHLPNTK